MTDEMIKDYMIKDYIERARASQKEKKFDVARKMYAKARQEIAFEMALEEGLVSETCYLSGRCTYFNPKDCKSKLREKSCDAYSRRVYPSFDIFFNVLEKNRRKNSILYRLMQETLSLASQIDCEENLGHEK